MTHLYVEYGVDILVYICVCSHIHVYIRNVYTYAIYTQLHPYTHTPSPIPFHAHQPTPARHLITSNPTRVPYACMPHSRYRHDNPTTLSDARTPLYHVPATLRDSHVMTGTHNHPTESYSYLYAYAYTRS